MKRFCSIISEDVDGMGKVLATDLVYPTEPQNKVNETRKRVLELIDEYDRNDAIHIVRNRDGITVDNLSTILKRNDIKKSEAYQSGFLEGTTPSYDAYLGLKKSIANSIDSGGY